MQYLLILFLLIPTIANAEVYVLFDKSTKEVKSISKRDDAVLEQGWEKTILDGKLSGYPLTYQAEYYTFENNRFIVNTKKLSDEANAIKKAEKRAKEMEKIERKKNKMAYEALKAEGVAFTELEDSDFGGE